MSLCRSFQNRPKRPPTHQLSVKTLQLQPCYQIWVVVQSGRMECQWWEADIHLEQEQLDPVSYLHQLQSLNEIAKTTQLRLSWRRNKLRICSNEVIEEYFKIESLPDIFPIPILEDIPLLELVDVTDRIIENKNCFQGEYGIDTISPKLYRGTEVILVPVIEYVEHESMDIEHTEQIEVQTDAKVKKSKSSKSPRPKRVYPYVREMEEIDVFEGVTSEEMQDTNQWIQNNS